MMFGLIFWLATAALTVAWALTGGEWFGFGVSVLFGARVALLVFCIGALADPHTLRKQRALHRKPPVSVQMGDYALDFVFLCVLGWIAQGGARYGFACVALYGASVVLWEIMHVMLEPKR